MRRILMSVMLFAVSCASTHARPDAKVPFVADPTHATRDTTVVVCENEAPTGSNIAETQCRRVQDMDADRRNAQDMLEQGPSHSPPRGSR